MGFGVPDPKKCPSKGHINVGSLWTMRVDHPLTRKVMWRVNELPTEPGCCVVYAKQSFKYRDWQHVHPYEQAI